MKTILPILFLLSVFLLRAAPITPPVKQGTQLMTHAAVAGLQPPSSITVTCSVPVVFITAPAITGPWTNMMPATFSMTLNADQSQAFIRARLDQFPSTNFPVIVTWHTNAAAAAYRIRFGAASGNYSQLVEVPAATNCWHTSIWLAWATNFVDMTCLDTNGVESAPSTELQYSPAVELRVRKN